MFDEPLVKVPHRQAYANGASTERAKEDLGQADRNGSIAAFNPSG